MRKKGKLEPGRGKLGAYIPKRIADAWVPSAGWTEYQSFFLRRDAHWRQPLR